MTYNFKRALALGLALYVATFIFAIIAGFVSGQDMSSLNMISDSFWYVGMVGCVIFSALFTVWYFKNPTVIPSAKSGFFFGLTAVALSSVLDLIFFTLGNMSDKPEAHVDLGKYYGDYRFWIIVVLVILTAKLVGHMKSQKPSSV